MDFTERLSMLEQRLAFTKAEVQAATTESRQQLRDRIDRTQSEIERSAMEAQQRADEVRAGGGWAESGAEDALDYAEWAAYNAELAMLDAIDARAYADDLARSAG